MQGAPEENRNEEYWGDTVKVISHLTPSNFLWMSKERPGRNPQLVYGSWDSSLDCLTCKYTVWLVLSRLKPPVYTEYLLPSIKWRQHFQVKDPYKGVNKVFAFSRHANTAAALNVN